jgi:tetratricopeptide (TPR) repeat protein
MTSSQMQCLRARLSSVDAKVSVLIQAPNQSIVERAKIIVDDFVPLDACDGTDATPTVIESTRERWKPLLKLLVEGQTMLGTNKLDDAERLAREVIDKADKLGEVEPRAAAMLMLGQAQARNGGNLVAAKKTLLEAVRAATIAHEDGMIVDAWLEMISLAFTDRSLLKDLDDEIFGAEVSALRVAATDDRQAQLAYKIGTVQLLRGEIDDALAKLEKARAAYADADRSKYEIAAVDNSIGVAHLYRGEWKQAREAFDRAIAVWEAIPFPNANHATSVGWIGELAAIQHDFAGAEEPYRREIELFTSSGKPGAPGAAKAKLKLGYLYARWGKCARATPLLTDARAYTTQRDGAGAALRAFLELAEAHCLVENGKSRAAIPILERALAAAEKSPATLLQVPLTRFTLARALVGAGKGKARARELAERAHDDFARLPGTRADRDSVSAWLRAQR